MAHYVADPRPLSVPERMLGVRVLAALDIVVFAGANHSHEAYELAAAEAIVGVDSEGSPACIVQFYFPVNGAVFIFDRHDSIVDFILLRAGIHKIVCDLRAETASLGLQIAEPVTDVQALFPQRLQAYAGGGPISLLKMKEARYLNHEARLCKEPESIYRHFQPSARAEELVDEAVHYAAFDCVATADIFICG